MRTVTHSTGLCIVGGGIAGLCAAVSAARHGTKVVLMQDRPVLGGNASSEVRMWICGANGKNNRETGIVEEIQLENFYRNASLSYSVWDSVLYEKARFEPNITLLLNCTCLEATMDGSRIKSVKGWQMTSETYHIVSAAVFADCSGDSVLAPLTGAQFMLGREAKSAFGESLGADTADKKTMGMSCLLQIRETDRPQPFIPPEWAYVYPTEESLKGRGHGIGSNYWWIELGGDRDGIHDTEDIRDELLKIAFGVWDHVKNYGDHGADNWALDWVGFLPGKRESRRYIGEYIITQNDVEAGGAFDDVVAYGGWKLDDHNPAGFYYDGEPAAFHEAPSPWGIPYRALYSKNIGNLMFAGRNISVTHIAMSSSRVIATCGLLGQALGTAAALAEQDGVSVREVDIEKLQQTLMDDDCRLPGKTRAQSALTKAAHVNAPIVLNGQERDTETAVNHWEGNDGESLTFTFDTPQKIKGIRIVFDSDLNRKYHNMPCYYPLNEERYKMPASMMKTFEITADIGGAQTVIYRTNKNRQRLVKLPVDVTTDRLCLIPRETYGDPLYKVFAVDFK